MEKVLVTGGLGYIGSHTLRVLQDKYDVVVVDNVSTGHFGSLPPNKEFELVPLDNKELLNHVFERYNVDSVIHFAGSIEAGESMINPGKFYQNNVANTINLLNSMIRHDVKRLVFSSSAGIFKESEEPLIETHLKEPSSVYGKTKLMVEEILKEYDKAHGLKSISMRYFNAAGAGYGIGEDHRPETHLIPLILQVPLGKRKNIQIFGTDYSTPDGTCIRDYVHVLDLARAHVLALEKLNETNRSDEFNLGNERGYSVREVIEMCRKVVGEDIAFVETERREGDPAILVADSSKAKKELGWKAKYGLEEIISSAWNWHKNNPNGFIR